MKGMTIIRDGKEIELTQEEIGEAHRIRERENLIDDIVAKSEDMKKPIKREQAEAIVDRVDKAVDNNSGCSESYWMSIEYVLEDEFKWTTVEAEVRISDAETKEFLYCETFTFDVPEGTDLEDYDTLFKYLFASYPEEFPEEHPGVDAEIVSVK